MHPRYIWPGVINVSDQSSHNILTSRAFSLSARQVLEGQQSSPHGLSEKQVEERLTEYGQNTLPQEKAPGIAKVFLYQFASPLIYILMAAAVMSAVIQEWSDAIFITAVLLINAIIGKIGRASCRERV